MQTEPYLAPCNNPKCANPIPIKFSERHSKYVYKAYCSICKKHSYNNPDRTKFIFP